VPVVGIFASLTDVKMGSGLLVTIGWILRPSMFVTGGGPM
jgi:hypothetical protein